MHCIKEHVYRLLSSEETASTAVAASKVDMVHLPWHPKEEPPPVISCRWRLPGRCLISWWIPPQLQLARHFTLGHKQTTPNPAHISWTNGLSPSLGKTKAIIHWVSRHERLRQCKQEINTSGILLCAQSKPEGQ